MKRLDGAEALLFPKVKGHALPVIAQAFIYTRLVPVNATTLVTMIAAAVAGSYLGAGIVCRWSRRSRSPFRPMNSSRSPVKLVTGSLIPQRIKLKPIGTTTVSSVRIIDRHEIDATGRRTTRGVLIADPSVRVIGH